MNSNQQYQSASAQSNQSTQYAEELKMIRTVLTDHLNPKQISEIIERLTTRVIKSGYPQDANQVQFAPATQFGGITQGSNQFQFAPATQLTGIPLGYRQETARPSEIQPMFQKMYSPVPPYIPIPGQLQSNLGLNYPLQFVPSGENGVQELDQNVAQIMNRFGDNFGLHETPAKPRPDFYY